MLIYDLEQLNAETADGSTYVVTLSNDKKVIAAKGVARNGKDYAWDIDGCLLETEDDARAYLKVCIFAKLTGVQLVSLLKFPQLDDRQPSGTIRTIMLANGRTIQVQKDKTYNGIIWAWGIDGQVFNRKSWATQYLWRSACEKLTGKRVIFHEKKSAPEICGQGKACRRPNACNSLLCSDCPVAEGFFAARDRLELIYAVKEDMQGMSRKEKGGPASNGKKESTASR